MGWIIAAIGLMGGLLGWYTKITIGTALSEFRELIRDEFGKRFMDATLATAKLDPLQKELDGLAEWIKSVDEYAHRRCHELSNEIQEIKLRIGERL